MRILGSLRDSVREAIQHSIATGMTWGESNYGVARRANPRRSLIMGFDLTDDEGKLMGRVECYIHRYGEVTPEQLLAKLEGRPA